VDFLVEDEDMGEVADWIAENVPFDRLYFYGINRPIHVSYSQTPKGEIVEFLKTENPERLVPRVRRRHLKGEGKQVPGSKSVS
jgi:hypothetical protein